METEHYSPNNVPTVVAARAATNGSEHGAVGGEAGGMEDV
ncbi:hypothetical protein SAMN05216564_11630 [Halopenitus persicus]|uniref:Uncharacterized protein n=1 Tax=Halopenitus persicus TaxID=1048396 RepID=A0A1H3NYD3_9EURY|nr:hypothetical protein SAMN05216564_11630 [Halopenitus persicus]